MDDEQFERQKEFILQQQAQFAAKIGQLEDNLARIVGVVERVVDTVARLAQVTAERFEAVDRRADETDRKLAALVDAQIQTEAALRNLAATVDRHVAEGHDGRARPES